MQFNFMAGGLASRLRQVKRPLGSPPSFAPVFKPADAIAKRIASAEDTTRIGSRKTMADIPGKACGPCTLCCKILEIEELKKPAGPFCGFCVAGGGCLNYEERPDVCRDFECLWKGDRGLTPMLRPDKVGTLLMEDADSEDYLAVCDPAKPLAWRTPLVFNHLVSIAKTGRTVLAKAGVKAWKIHPSGQWGPYA